MKSIFVRLIVLVFLFGLPSNIKAQQSTGFGSWRLYYFEDDFGDPMYDKPFLETTVKNSNGDILIIGLTNKTDSGMDIMSMGINDGYSLKYLDKNATVSFKTANGRVYKYSVPSNNMSGGQIFLINQTDLTTIATIMNSGNYKVSISAHWRGDNYMDPNRSWNFSVTSQTKGIVNAYMKYLH